MLLCIFTYLLYSGAFRFIVKLMQRFIIIFCLIFILPLPAAADPVEDLQTLLKQNKFSGAIRSGETLLRQNSQ